ncbi:MAG: UvrD-helicase domain-containing protein, partial [Ignavibacteriales bacterium]|nr:UvrD-helicase domain-containing protein [Ignavibacteriales bacterium]
LLLRPIELFTHHNKILLKYQDRFRFILIDEYQDTNRAQYVLIKLLADQYRNICVVGDDAQSIYAFRGADIRNILDFERDYPNAVIVRLEQNYRSTRTILSAADQVIKKNIDQITKDLWTENQEGDKITILACEDDQDEGATIVSRIYEESNKLKLQFKDIAIMYRTNAQSRSLEDALRKNSIPYMIIGGVEFYQRKEVKDVLAYLRLLVNPRDDESFMRIVNVPARGLGDVAVGRLRDFAATKSLTLFEATDHASEVSGLTSKARTSVEALSVMFKKYLRLTSEMSMSELSRALVDEIGILPLLKEEGTVEAMSRWENIQELLSAITEFSELRADATLENFLQEVSLVSDIDTWEETANAVTLLTLHSAKGLEFPIVFIAGLEEGLLPLYSTVVERKELEEERRLYYVGMTRAMKKLYLSYAKVRFRFGEMSYQSPSRFLDEMEGDLVETVVSSRRHVSRDMRSFSLGDRNRDRKDRKKTDAESHYFSDTMPDYENASDVSNQFRAGNIVEHEVFGRGKVLHVSGSGEFLKAVVDFPAAGKKNLMLKYARLKVL